MLLDRSFFFRHPVTCAVELVGCELVWGECSGTVVETEAYAAHGDESCHTFLRRGARQFVDENPAGSAYVYLNYGVYWLLNVLVKGRGHDDPAGDDGFVLVRALHPRRGLPQMQARRGPAVPAEQLCAGPGRLTIALGILPADHRRDLCADPGHGFHGPVPLPGQAASELVADRRIGITRAAEFPWRFLPRGCRYVSRRPSRFSQPHPPGTGGKV